MRILFLSRWFPYPPDNGSRIRIFNILKQLAAHHDVTLLSFGEPATVDEASAFALRQFCSDVRMIHYRAFRPSSTAALLGLVSTRPRSLVDAHSAEMSAAVADEVHGRHYDLVVASELDMAPYALPVRGVPTLLEELELSVAKDAMERRASLAGRLRARLTWTKLSAYVRRILPIFAACTVVSEHERANLRRIAPDYMNVSVIPNAVDLQDYIGITRPVRPNTLTYSGALTYRANHDAVQYFLADIYPTIVDAVPDVTLRVTGRHTGVDLEALSTGPGVHYTGYVDDVRPAVAESCVSVVPLRIGGGTRLKILESMALGTPVVSTSKGAEGLEVTDGENILIADEPQAFARRVLDVLGSRELRHRLAIGGRRLVESTYDWRTVGRQLLAVVERAAASRAA